ncbi:MAG: DoxX family protein [Emcibacter sp.]|nr:DoxX family protein [Emcibacter sp.]
MNADKLIEVILWVLCLVLAMVFFYNGASKILGFSYQVAQFEALGISVSMLIAVGVVECLGGLMLITPRLTVAGATILGLIMLTSATLHLSHGNYTSSFRAVVIVVLLMGISYFRSKRTDAKDCSE